MFKVRKIKGSYYRHNYYILVDLLTYLKVIDEYEHNMLSFSSNRQQILLPENKSKEPSNMLMESFNFSESSEGVDYWIGIVKEVKDLQITKTL